MQSSSSSSGSSSPGYQCQSLNRSNTFSRTNASPKCFGTSQFIHKEEHERERRRWQEKLDEAEDKLVEASVNNSDMAQIKAELNKKIVEFEKNQRPLIEQNKRLSDRNRIIQAELKRLEDSLCHSQDDYLTLKDAFSRLTKENASLKEQRAFPEKVKELERYRNQVLEYSKCINALRQSGLEKDRRYELLVQKFKRMKKCLAKKVDDDDRQSFYGSEGSTESSINLDTINEDIDEALDIDASTFNYDHEVVLKLNALALGEEQLLKEQLEVANEKITELEAALDTENRRSRTSQDLSATVSEQRCQIQELQGECDGLRCQLANAEENNELLEFQILELRETSLGVSVAPTEHKEVATEEYIDDEELQCVFNDIKAFVQMEGTEIAESKERLRHIRQLACLQQSDRDCLRAITQYIENVENKLSFAETELNMTSCELKRVESAKNDEIGDLRQQINELDSKTSKRKKELQGELDSTRKELSRIQTELAQKEKQQAGLTTKVEEISAALRAKEQQSACEKLKIQELTEKMKAAEVRNSEEVSDLKSQLSAQIRQTEAAEVRLAEAKKSLNLLLEEKESLDTEVAALNAASREKGEQLEQEVAQIREQFAETKKDYESKVAEARREAVSVEAQRKELAEQHEHLQGQLFESQKSLKKMQEDLEAKLEAVKRDADSALVKQKTNADQELSRLQQAKKEVDEALAMAQTEILVLKGEIRPIGSQLERRYEDTRYRLEEANQTNTKLQEQLQDALTKIDELTGSQKSVQEYIQEIQQLKTYNRELEDQFNAQMDIITALKKKFIACNNNGADVVDWTKKAVAQPSNSLDDEQYHSEGSSSVSSFGEIRNHA